LKPDAASRKNGSYAKVSISDQQAAGNSYSQSESLEKWEFFKALNKRISVVAMASITVMEV
jgi:hypothetical protein